MNISLLVTSFGRGRLFENSLSSILDQLTPDDEIVVVNDGHPDSMEQLLKGCMVQDKSQLSQLVLTPLRTKYIDTGNRQYRGGSIAKNVALKACSNELIIIHDPEMLNLSPCIQQIKEYFANPNHVDHFLTCGTVYTAVDKEHTRLEEANFIAHSQAPFIAGVLKKHLMNIGGWDERFVMWGNDDSWLMYRLGKNGIQVKKDEGIVAFHQWHERPSKEAMGDYNESLLYAEDKDKYIVANQDNPHWGELNHE